ncbi:hypothetical protein VaNZ11_005949 [Volvox africanus]|uniref:Uncharacterized protein n=1 Tax=Volvox africanus TaxID=51714 RepID=A0ABQ5S0D7_9CHLO|nr:hypothetical protein VaNZ11_005949 [Volvox africanus]
MEEVQSPTADTNSPQPQPSTANWKLGENLALSHLSALPELPQYNAEDYKLQQLQYAMHLDSAMLTYTPAPGFLKNGDPQQAANRFDDSKTVKRKIFVNKEVLGRLVSVAEELNKAQAQIEIRKLLKREHRRRPSEPQPQQQPQPADGNPADGNSATIAELLAGLEVEGGADEDAAGAGVGYNGGRRLGARMAKRAPGVYRMAQVRCPAVLTSMAPKDRWGYFRAMQRLMPAANGGRPGHIAFGSMAPQLAPSGRARARVTGAAAVKAAKQLQMEVERQAEAALGEASITECGEEDGQGSAAAGIGGARSGVGCGGDALASLDATVQAALHANQVREARRAAARQLAEEEGLPTETWWDIMQKRKKVVYFKKLLDEMTGRMDMIKLHRAARVIQQAWRAHHRTRTRNASEEIALLQKELAHRKAMEGALRAAAEAAILDQQERAKKRAARLAARIAALNAMQEAAAQQAQQQTQHPSQSGASESHAGRGGNNGTFSRATSSKNLGWQHSLRSSIPSSMSRSASMSASRAASARRLELAAAAAGEGDDGGQPAYALAQNNLWSKIQALIGTDWDVDGEEDSEEEDDEDGYDDDDDDNDDEEEEDGDSEDEAAQRLRRRRERNEVRKARKAAADAAAAAAAGGDGEQKKKKKKGRRGRDESMAPMSKTTMLVKVVKQAMMAAKAMQDEDEKKGGGKRNRRKDRRSGGANADPATSMRMLATAAAALNMSVEAYVAMRNRKLGVTALKPWQPPPFPLLIEADGKPIAIEEHELREMEEEARRELLEKAAINFVTAATAAAGTSASTTFSGSAPGRTGSTMSGTASVALSADASSVMTWGSAAAAALAGGEGSERLLLSSLSLSENRSASEVAAAFAAAAAPSLTIPEDDVWTLVKEKLRQRMAARAADAHGGTVSAVSATASTRKASFFDSDSDYDDNEYSSSDDDGSSSAYDTGKTRQRRRDRPHHPNKHRSGGGAGGGALEGRRAKGGPLPGRRAGSYLSDSGYETMSEDEIRMAGRATLLRIQHQKERSRKHLQGYYTDRRRAKKAAAAAAVAALQAERAAALTTRHDALALRRRGAIAGPAWRPGGGGALQRRNHATATVAGASANDVAPTKSPPIRFWRPAPPRRPPGPLHGASVDGEGGAPRDSWSMEAAAPKPPLIRLGPYNLSPGGPSLLYREPRHRSREGLTSRERASVRAAKWMKGAEVPGAVFTQYGWVQARSNGAGNLLTLQLQSLPEPELVPVLEAYVRQLGIPQDGLGTAKTSLGCNRPHLLPGGHLPPSMPHQGRMQPLMVGGRSALDVRRAVSPSGGAARPPPAPNSVAAIFGAASAGFFVGHAPVIPHPPGHQPPSAVVRPPPPVAVTSPTRGPVPLRAEVGNTEDDVEAVEAMTSTAAAAGGSRAGPVITDKGDGSNGLGVPTVLGRALGSPTSSSRSLLARVRFNGEGQERTGLAGGSGSISRRSHTTSRRSMSPLLVVPGEEWPLRGDRVLGSAMTITPRIGAGSGSGTSFRSVSRGARSASTAFTAAASGGEFGEPESDGGVSAGAEDTFAVPRTESLQSPGQQEQDEDVAILQGEPFEVALAVLRSKSIKPGVAERVFPQGLAHINDPTSNVAPQHHEGDGGNADADGPMSYPLDDISSSSSSDNGDDGDGWATASDEGDRQGEQTTAPDVDADADAAGPGGHDEQPPRQSLQGGAVSQSIPLAVAPPATAGGPRGRAAPRTRQVHPMAAAAPARQAPDVCAVGNPTAITEAASSPSEVLLRNDENGERQFDLLYDMTRWAATRPSTPTNYRVEDHHIAITLRRSKEAKQRDQEEVHQVRRARLLAAYGGGAGAAVFGGNAYERVLFRRRHARALAALAASQSPLAQLLRAVAFDRQVAGKPLLQHHAAAGGGSAGRTGSFGDGLAVGEGRRRARRVGAAGGGRRLYVASSAVPGDLNGGVIWMPARGSRVDMRVKPGGGCVSGFGNSYYWRQPVRLTSLINIRPAAPAGQINSTDAFEGRGAQPRELTRARSRGVSARHTAAVPPPPPEVTEMANTALKLLSDLGSEIGRMEVEIQTLQRQAEQDELRRQGVSGGPGGDARPTQAASPVLAASHGTAATAPSASPPPPPRSPSGSLYRTQYITFHHQCHVQAQGPQQLAHQQSQQQRPASRCRVIPAPSNQRLTLMTLEPPTGIHGTSVPRMPHRQGPISPPQGRSTQGGRATQVITNGGTGGSSISTVTATAAAAAPPAAVGNRRSVTVGGGTAQPLSASVEVGRASTSTVALQGVAEPPDVTGSGEGGAGGSGSPPDDFLSHSAPLLRLSQPPTPSGACTVSPKLQNVSSVVSRSGSSFESNTAGQLGPVESALLDTVMPPGPPLTAPAASNAGGRRLASNPVLMPTPHNTLSSNGGWPSSCLSTISGMAPMAADAVPVSPQPPSPPVGASVPVWASPRRSITGAEPAAVASIARVVWELPSPRPAAAGTAAAAAVVAVPTPMAASQSSTAPLGRVGVHPYPRHNSPPTLLPNIGTIATATAAAALHPLRPSSDGVGTRLANQVATLSSSSASAVVAAAAAAGAAVAVTAKGSPSHRQGSAGHEVAAAPPSPPLAAWGATSSVLVGVLPEISQMSFSPRNYAPGQQTMRSSVSYSASGSPAGGAGNAAISSGGRVSTPLLVGSRAGPAAAASPPHSPLRNYPRMELGLGAGASPYRLRHGSSNGPSAVYYQYSVGGGGGGGTQVAINDGYDNGISVDSLLMNVALFGPGGLGGSGLGDRAAAGVRASAPAAPSTRWPRASDASLTMPTPLTPLAAPLTSTVSAATVAPTTDVTIGGSPRFTRVRRLSMGPLPGSGSSGSGTAAAVSP